MITTILLAIWLISSFAIFFILLFMKDEFKEIVKNDELSEVIGVKNAQGIGIAFLLIFSPVILLSVIVKLIKKY